MSGCVGWGGFVGGCVGVSVGGGVSGWVGYRWARVTYQPCPCPAPLALQQSYYAFVSLDIYFVHEPRLLIIHYILLVVHYSCSRSSGRAMRLGVLHVMDQLIGFSSAPQWGVV